MFFNKGSSESNPHLAASVEMCLLNRLKNPSESLAYSSVRCYPFSIGSQ